MKYTVSVCERVNLGNYEHVELRAEITFDSSEINEPPEEFAKEQLDVLLLSHRRRAQSLLPEDSESFISYHPALER